MKRFISCFFLFLAISIICVSCPEPFQYMAMNYYSIQSGPGYSEDFEDYDTGVQIGVYGIDIDNNIHIDGLINYTGSSSPGTISIFTLPEGFRPSSFHYYSVPINGSTTDRGYITVTDQGVVLIRTSVALDWFSFGHIVVNK